MAEILSLASIIKLEFACETRRNDTKIRLLSSRHVVVSVLQPSEPQSDECYALTLASVEGADDKASAANKSRAKKATWDPFSKMPIIA